MTSDLPAGAPEWLASLVTAVRERPEVPFLVPPADGTAGLRRAAVLVLFGAAADGGPDVLLLKRNSTMRTHAGQPAFPGGRIDPSDGGPVGAAVREAHEETGLDPAGVEVLGEVPELWIPPSGNIVTPVIAWWREPSAVHAAVPEEVETVARVPVADLVDPANRLMVTHPLRPDSPAFRVAGMLVWGFTAGVLSWLLTLTGWEQPWDHTVVEPVPDPVAWRLMDTLDVILIVVCIGFGISGYRQGFVVGILGFAGFLGGGVLGAKYANSLHSALHLGIDPALFGLLVVVVASILGQLVATLIGATLRRELTWRPLRYLDSAAGGFVSVVSVLIVAWLVGTALAHTATSGVSRQVRNSAVLRAVDHVMPSDATTWFGSFRRLLDQDGVPEVFGGIGPSSVAPVSPPNPKLAHSRAVELAHPDVVKIVGVADSCSRRLEGSGFIYAPDRVMTNAHVVAGVGSPEVSTPAGQTLHATVVLYDPKRDVAVLDVPGLGGTPLTFAQPIGRGHNAIVVGYPEDGPFTAVPARVRTIQNARGPDIYEDAQVTRQIYALYATVRPGNSGGPLLTPRGKVAGVVFASAVDHPNTGYALTAAEVAGDAAAGRQATGRVSTQGCD